MALAKDYYQTLGLDSSRNGKPLLPSEVKQAYRKALLFYHPDKQDNESVRPKTKDPVPSIDEITNAYKVLSDTALRDKYDRELRLQRPDDDDDVGKVNTRHTGMETVDLEELDFDEARDCWTRPCRCGNKPAFMITESELEKNADYGELITVAKAAVYGSKFCSAWRIELAVVYSRDSA